MSNFVFFDGHKATNNSTTPKITIRRGGVIVLNAGAEKMIGGEEVTHVQIAYDEKEKAIGIRPASDDATGRIRLRKQKKGASRIVSGKRFFEHHGLALEKATSYDVKEFEDGLIGVTLGDDTRMEKKSIPPASGKRKTRAAS